MKYAHLISFISIVLILTSCQDKTTEIDEKKNEKLIVLSKEQFHSNQMEIGSVHTHCFEDIIRCNGNVKSSPKGIAKINTPISGIVKNIYFSQGEYVKKGQVIYNISSNEFIELQQEFAESCALLTAAKSDYKRAKALLEEQIGSEKDFIHKESHFKAVRIKYEALKLQLQLLQLPTDKIENGEFYPLLTIFAPISGHIMNSNIVLGQYIKEDNFLSEIIDQQQLQIQFTVFEKNIYHIKNNQSIQFSCSGNPNEKFTAEIISIGKAIDPITKGIACLAKINSNDKTKFYNGSYIEVEVITDKKDLIALSNDAILESGNERYIFVIDRIDDQNYYLHKEKVQMGYESEEYSEIVSIPELTKIITKGINYLATK